ncbi:MAG TPA: beta-phosphoglucomutase [Cyclobacteriaceae bacterium]|jgi:beta-phosphoglucomutase|nr:beta-phosphoglucomutase [Cytophagales bacterium]HNT50685.1 beta-phosphoglucomutase [Cyclobacteriaceae bacterium]HRE68156.1 beta-phosphoglucomutase [Cyclobacteriaceae bacterium]HRF34498.1 beta-phosphoglucomutase [Cyclobacteriaceae bacterium]
MIQAVIFDLDGVIVDTAHYHYIAWKRLASEFGITLTPAHNELLKGVSRMHSLEIILSLGNIQLPQAEKEALADKKNKWFIEYIESIRPEEIFPGVPELLKSCRAHGFKVALASSSKNAPRVIELLGVAPLFDTLVDGTMITHSKPNPEIFLLAASRLNVIPTGCLVFEDAEAGVEAALAAGMKCVGVGSPDQLSKANLIVKQTADFNVNTINTIF